MADLGAKPEIQWVHHKRGGAKTQVGLESNVDDGETFALRAVIEYSDKGLPGTTTLTINSPNLLRILKPIIQNHPSVSTDFESPFGIEKPYQPLYHHWDELHAAYEQDQSTDDERMHLKLLLKFMAQEMGRDKGRIESMCKSGSITYETMWAIFRPNDLLYIPDVAGPWLLRAVRTAYDENKKIGKYMDVHCWYNDYDGNIFGRAEYQIRIVQKIHFPGGQPSAVESLPIYPFSFLTGDTDIEIRLAERGERFRILQEERVKYHDGIAWHVKDIPVDWFTPDYHDQPALWLPYMETGRVILDKKAFIEDNYADRVNLSLRDMKDESQRMLCPPFTQGFSLVRKKWCKFSIDRLTATRWNKSALDNVILDEHRKDVLQSLVLGHEFPQGAVDFFSQKGKGLVVLLYGSPGSGKTMTAESVAEAAEKPLIRATMGELSQIDGQYWFELALQRLLKLATTWQAVVLLDEADVFFEGRSDTPGKSSEHNALVAVLLKHLEYFGGIIFLTSNLVRVFDTAVKSRIHLALEYHPPDTQMMRRIWENAVSAIPESEKEPGIEKALENFLANKLNGREIANCIHTSRTLARHEKTKLRPEHIEKVLTAKQMFEKSFREIQAKGRAADIPISQGISRRNTFEMADSDD